MGALYPRYLLDAGWNIAAGSSPNRTTVAGKQRVQSWLSPFMRVAIDHCLAFSIASAEAIS
jgi:hypothetical protein